MSDWLAETSGGRHAQALAFVTHHERNDDGHYQ